VIINRAHVHAQKALPPPTDATSDRDATFPEYNVDYTQNATPPQGPTDPTL
jgi:hypothetical protein